jgi:hypothetical protein
LALDLTASPMDNASPVSKRLGTSPVFNRLLMSSICQGAGSSF